MPENLSFAGCGFLGIYHIGVAAALKDHAPHLLDGLIGGASAGSMAAAGLLCGIPVEVMTSSVAGVAMAARKRLLGPFSPSFHIDTLLKEGMYEVFPPDAHLRVSGKIQISVTRVYDMKNILLTNFDTLDDLIIAILCSSFIPGFSGWLPYALGNSHYIDGGFSDNLPQLDKPTITVSPFAGEADICPKDGESSTYTLSLFGTSVTMSLENLHRLSRVMLPPSPQDLQKMCQQGYTDTCEFLMNQNIHTHCSAIPSYESFKPDLPEAVLAVFEEIIANEEVANDPAKIMENSIVSLQLANFTCYKFLETIVQVKDTNYTYTKDCLLKLSTTLNQKIDSFYPHHQRAMDRFYEAYDKYGVYSILTSYAMLSLYGIFGAYICLQDSLL